jgi:RNA polymerase sigma-70 factor (ECF subfamily)
MMQTREHNISDEELVEKFKAGDFVAFELLVKRHYQFALNVCNRYLFCEEDAKDAAQEIFIKAYKAIDQFKPEAQFRTWFYRILINHCLNVLRTRKRKRWLATFASLGKSLSDNDTTIFEAENNPERQFEAKEKKIVIRNALLQLKERYRTPLILHRYEGLSYKDIADILNISLAAVESRIFRAKQQLADLLADYLD